MRKFIKYSICFPIAIFILSCNNDELEKNQENVKVVKSELELAKFSNSNIAQNVDADFENVNEIEKDDFKISEFSAKEKVANYFESDLLQNQLKYQGVTIKNEGKTHSYFLEVFTFQKSVAYPETITKLENFTGGLNVYSFDGKNLGSVGVRNGEATNFSGENELDILTKAINLFYTRLDIISKIPLCDRTYTQTVELAEDRWKIVSQGPKILDVIFEGTKVTRTTTILPYPCDGPVDIEVIKLQRIAHFYRYSDGGQYLGESYSLQIIDNLIGKAKCLNSLLTQNGNSFVQKLLANFEGKSDFNIKIVSKDQVFSDNAKTNEINGATLPPIGNLVNIEISTSKANSNSALDVARTILHEYIHADIFRKLGTKLGTDKERLDFKTTYEAYGNQHSMIASLYLNSMKDALKEFHKTVLTDDYNKYTQYYEEAPSDAFYEALAWGGLKDANVKAWTDLPADKKAAIEALSNRVPMLSKTVPCVN